ncbi:DUF1294 domain-containing protein [Undibacterium terreum]|uniref:DUF1294 domain-containing protein n=1 Tax=Undibacterium terreum TaxID=1224302 RepID=A0A916UNT8_9BURK|nr:DUF1294 domain-containing protein [Undibacterium terreum]GGC77640.1 hypothetical protein GCM10011396_26010 [Undibacterium terreum]
MPWILALVYGVASVLSLAMYAVDKSAAKNNRWRISENTLHAVSLAGGWPGALLAQSLLHHKNKKTSFQIVFWLTVILNFAALLWLAASDFSGSLLLMK